MHNPHPRELWLEPVLERHLGQVAAPDRLWEMIQHPPDSRRRRHVPAPLLTLAAAMLLAAAAWMLVPRHGNEGSSSRALAIQALAREPEDLDLRSDTATEIRSWVKSRTGLDIPLPAATSGVVRMTGVCAVKGGAPAVEVAYQVSGHNAALLVSRASLGPSGDLKHRFLKCESIGSTRVSSWTMRGQLYTLAYAATGNLRDECLLCHTGTQPLTLSN